MLRVYKYQITMQDHLSLELPTGSKILKIMTQFDQPYLWALVDTNHRTETREFRIAGTGHPISINKNEKLDYIDTLQMLGGNLIYHVFEIKRI